jgi:opacity protein-like surface antigen
VRLSGSGALVTFFAIVFPCAASAQSVAEAKTWTATPLLSATTGTSGDLGSSLGIGAALGYDLTSNLGFEGELARAFDLAGNDADVDVSVTTFSGNAVYHFDVRRVTPYATFGLGFERLGVHVKVPEKLALYAPSSTEIAYNFGGGVKYPVSDRLLARADLRRFQATDLAPDHWRLYGGLTFWIRR